MRHFSLRLNGAFSHQVSYSVILKRRYKALQWTGIRTTSTRVSLHGTCIWRSIFWRFSAGSCPSSSALPAVGRRVDSTAMSRMCDRLLSDSHTLSTLSLRSSILDGNSTVTSVFASAKTASDTSDNIYRITRCRVVKFLVIAPQHGFASRRGGAPIGAGGHDPHFSRQRGTGGTKLTLKTQR